MYKILISQFGQYKKAAILTPVFTGLEALMELLIPFSHQKLLMRESRQEIWIRYIFMAGSCW